MSLLLRTQMRIAETQARFVVGYLFQRLKHTTNRRRRQQIIMAIHCLECERIVMTVHRIALRRMGRLRLSLYFHRFVLFLMGHRNA